MPDQAGSKPAAVAVGLTGGIGSGKSTVSEMLAERGAKILDADLIAHEVLEPGGAAYELVVKRFGDGILAADGTIERPELASLVFADPTARADLEAIVHPAVGAEMARRLFGQRSSGEVVVLDVPLLVEAKLARQRTGSRDYPGADLLASSGVVVVDAPEELARKRLMSSRGMTAAQVDARMAAQASRAQRLKVADFVIDNSGSFEELESQVDQAWEWMRALR
ncbi:MAG: dephospho-CoA kinase [Actinobacteria bacterium]|nr:dephospho-CoA kinase [Actinomycetota bacterium]